MSQQSKVLREFTSHPGEILYKEDIASTTGMTERQVVNAIWILAQKGHAILKVAEGSWKYDPQAKELKGKTLFELLARTKTGSVVLQDEDGSIWVAKPADF